MLAGARTVIFQDQAIQDQAILSLPAIKAGDGTESLRPERCTTAATMATWPASGMIGQGADSHRARPAPFRGDLAEEPNGLHGHRPPP